MSRHASHVRQNSFTFRLNQPLALPGNPDRLPPTITVWFVLPHDEISRLEASGVPRVKSVTQSMGSRRVFMRQRLARGEAFSNVCLQHMPVSLTAGGYRLVHVMLVLLKMGGRRDCLVLTYEKDGSSLPIKAPLKDIAETAYAKGAYRSVEVEVCQGGFTLFPSRFVHPPESSRFVPLRLASGVGADVLTIS